jgi:hypothetical protein
MRLAWMINPLFYSDLRAANLNLELRTVLSIIHRYGEGEEAVAQHAYALKK